MTTEAEEKELRDNMVFALDRAQAGVLRTLSIDQTGPPPRSVRLYERVVERLVKENPWLTGDEALVEKYINAMPHVDLIRMLEAIADDIANGSRP